MPTLTYALKEWSVAVNALEQGQTILLLRKGGIREASRHFQVPYQDVLLYSTFEHQKPELLKPEYRSGIVQVQPGWHPAAVEIRAWATITNHFQVTDATSIDHLYPFHIWNDQFIRDRLSWQPGHPLNLLLLRVFRLLQPISIDYQPAFGGCRSWLDLTPAFQHGAAVTLENSQPVLPTPDYQSQVTAIQSCIEMAQNKNKSNVT